MSKYLICLKFTQWKLPTASLYESISPKAKKFFWPRHHNYFSLKMKRISGWLKLAEKRSVGLFRNLEWLTFTYQGHHLSISKEQLFQISEKGCGSSFDPVWPTWDPIYFQNDKVVEVPWSRGFFALVDKWTCKVKHLLSFTK